MELALNLGITLADVKRLSEKELSKWALYSRKYRLPLRRRDLYLAQLALCTSRGPVEGELSLDDFLFDPPEESSSEDAFESDAEALGFNPVNPKE